MVTEAHAYRGKARRDLGPIPGMGVVGKFPNTASWTGITALLQTSQPLQTLQALQASKGRFFAFLVAGDRAADTAHQSCEARWEHTALIGGTGTQ